MADSITVQEIHVLQAIGEGMTFSEIAKRMGVSESRIKNIRADLCIKIKTRRLAVLIKWGIENGYILVNMHPDKPDLKLLRPTPEYVRFIPTHPVELQTRRRKGHRENWYPPACCDAPDTPVTWNGNAWVCLSSTGNFVEYQVHYCPFCGAKLADVTSTRTNQCDDEICLKA